MKVTVDPPVDPVISISMTLSEWEAIQYYIWDIEQVPVREFWDNVNEVASIYMAMRSEDGNA